MNSPVKRAFFDKLVNFVSGLGTIKDKNFTNQFYYNEITKDQLEAAYRSDWVSRKIIDIPVEDSTREWRAWQAENKQIEKLEEEEKRVGFRHKLGRAMRMARLYGGGALVLGVDVGTADQELKLDQIKVGSLKFIHAVSRHQLNAGPLVDDLMSPLYGGPEYFERNNTKQGMARIHPSRVVRLVGNEVPDEDTAGLNGWGDSVLTSVDEAVKHVGVSTGGIATLINELKIDVIRIPNLMDQLATTEYSDRLTERFQYANVAKSHINALLLDKEEEWERINASLAGAPDILKLYLLIASGAADIPATRFLGQSAVGLGATGEGDTRNYYDRISSDQNSKLSPALAIADEVLIRSALGTRDPNIYYDWNPLWQLNDTEKAALSLSKAQTFQIDVNLGMMSPEVLKKARENQLIEDGTYPGIEAAIEDEGGKFDPVEEAAAQQQTQIENQKQLLLTKQSAGTPLSKDEKWFLDEYNPNQPRAPKGDPDGGKWVPQYAGINGTAAERIDLRKKLKEEQDPDKRKELQHKIIESFHKQRNAALKKGDTTKAAELEGKLQKYSKEYGIKNPVGPASSLAEANKGYTAAQTAAATEVMKEVGISYSAAEQQNFNDLVSLVGESPAKTHSKYAKAAIAKYGLKDITAGELSNVYAYSHSAFKNTNKSLRAGVMNEATWRHVNSLDDALSKLSAYRGKVYRKTDMPKDIADLYQPGMIVTERGFTSTSRNTGVWHGDYHFEITSKTGRDIQKFSHHAHEAEVLFRSGTRFRIKNRSHKNNHTTIEMEEV